MSSKPTIIDSVELGQQFRKGKPMADKHKPKPNISVRMFWPRSYRSAIKGKKPYNNKQVNPTITASLRTNTRMNNETKPMTYEEMPEDVRKQLESLRMKSYINRGYSEIDDIKEPVVDNVPTALLIDLSDPEPVPEKQVSVVHNDNTYNYLLDPYFSLNDECLRKARENNVIKRQLMFTDHEDYVVKSTTSSTSNNKVDNNRDACDRKNPVSSSDNINMYYECKKANNSLMLGIDYQLQHHAAPGSVIQIIKPNDLSATKLDDIAEKFSKSMSHSRRYSCCSTADSDSSVEVLSHEVSNKLSELSGIQTTTTVTDQKVQHGQFNVSTGVTDDYVDSVAGQLNNSESVDEVAKIKVNESTDGFAIVTVRKSTGEVTQIKVNQSTDGFTLVTLDKSAGKVAQSNIQKPAVETIKNNNDESSTDIMILDASQLSGEVVPQQQEPQIILEDNLYAKTKPCPKTIDKPSHQKTYLECPSPSFASTTASSSKLFITEIDPLTVLKGPFDYVSQMRFPHYGMSAAEVRDGKKIRLMRKVVVIGASGELGREFCLSILKMVGQLVILARESSDLSYLDEQPYKNFMIARIDFDNMIKETKPEMFEGVVAAVSFLQTKNRDFPEESLRLKKNFEYNVKFAHLMKECGAVTMLYASSLYATLCFDEYTKNRRLIEQLLLVTQFRHLFVYRVGLIDGQMPLSLGLRALKPRIKNHKDISYETRSRSSVIGAVAAWNILNSYRIKSAALYPEQLNYLFEHYKLSEQPRAVLKRTV